MNVSPTPVTETVVPLSPISRVVNVFFSPTTTFVDIKRDPSWCAAWLLISVFSLLFVFAMQQKVGFAQMVQNEINASPKAQERMEKATPEQRTQQIQVGAAITKYITWATPIVILIIAALVAAVNMGTFNFGTGTEIGFSTSMAVVMYSFIP